jgi:hypothetical protein
VGRLFARVFGRLVGGSDDPPKTQVGSPTTEPASHEAAKPAQ